MFISIHFEQSDFPYNIDTQGRESWEITNTSLLIPVLHSHAVCAVIDDADILTFSLSALLLSYRHVFA